VFYVTLVVYFLPFSANKVYQISLYSIQELSYAELDSKMELAT